MMPAELERILPALERHGLRLTPDEQERIVAYVELLERWNQRINLTAIRGRAQIYVRHVLDCLLLETWPWPPGVEQVVDIGSGAGLPGLLVALRHPRCTVTALETVAKKVTFLQEAARAMGLAGFHPLRTDAQRHASAEGAGRYDLALARAFSDLARGLPLAERLLRPRGEFWTFKGERLQEELAAVAPDTLARFEPGPALQTYREPDLDLAGVLVRYRKRAAA